MAQIMRELQFFYDRALEMADPRVQHLPLMGSPLPMLAIVALYVFFVKYLGPKMMQNRPPMEIRNVMIVYDIIIILLNGYMVQQSTTRLWFCGRYHIYKEPVDYSNDPFAVEVTYFSWIYLVTKVLDLLDTVFIIVRKKSNQLSFLHKYHHAFMLVMTWIGVSYTAGGSFIMLGTINCFVHTVMYSYYLLTVINPKYKKYIWCKRRLTELQIVQFLCLLVWGLLMTSHNDTAINRVYLVTMLPQNLFITFMFCDFYKKRYLTKKTLKTN